MRHPGEVWFLPPDAVEGGDGKGRRHVLLTPCADEDDRGILAYASTQGTEAAHGAAALLLDPSVTSYGRSSRTGFTRPTYIYPSRLVGAASDEMQRRMGRLVEEVAALRMLLLRALGIGTGTAEAGFRGHVVAFTEDLRGRSTARTVSS